MASELLKCKNTNLTNDRDALNVLNEWMICGVKVELPATESAVQPATQYGFRRVRILPASARPMLTMI